MDIRVIFFPIGSPLSNSYGVDIFFFIQPGFERD